MFRYIRFFLGVYGLAFSLPNFADSSWIGTTSDLNTPTNWNPTGVPTNSDIANFDSSIPGINTSPQSSLTDFSVNSFNFVNSASSFNFLFEKCSLSLDGAGITGLHTDTAITITNIDNPDSLTTNLEFTNNSTNITSGQARITINNSGTGSGSGSSIHLSEIGTNQLVVSNPFFMSDYGELQVENSGFDATTGSGNNSIGTTSYQQIDFDDDVTLGNHVKLTISNSGVNSSTGSASYVGDLEEGQLTVGGTFSAGNYLNFSITNSGGDFSTGDGGNETGYVHSEGLMDFDQDFIVGNNAIIFGSNTGSYGGTNAVSGNDVGYESGSSFYVSGSLQSGNNLDLRLVNNGISTGTGVGGNRIGYTSGGQIDIGNSINLGNNALIRCSNTGINLGSHTINGDSVGVVNQQQFNLSQSLNALDDFTMNLSNFGIDLGGGIGNNQYAYVGGQLQIGGPVNLANRANISCSNLGGYLNASSVNPSNIGYVSGDQMDFAGAFSAENDFSLSVSNIGVDDGSNSNGSSVGYVNGTQIRFENTCSVGDHAAISASNFGGSSLGTLSSQTVVPNDPIIPNNNFLGVISGSQLHFTGNFTSGKNLTMTATNEAQISGIAPNVGLISGSQIEFDGQANFEDGAVIASFNRGNGTIFGSQINFQQGFNILNGRITIHALNEGTINGGYGIAVYESLGGNANIVLANSSLFVDTPHATFTIGELNGDSTSVVQSRPELVIATDADVNANFAGDIQNFGVSGSTLTKRGAGSQELSGTNTYTGLTRIEEGTLIVNGSLAGAMRVEEGGILKGIGSIAGDVENLGTISPGQSIGTLHFLSNYSNPGGNYAVEVNGAGQSDLIDVTGTATLNGGTVVVSSVDGTYRFQDRYTIVEAESVVGTYTGAISASLIQPIVSYDAQHVYLLLLTDIARAAETPNQLAIALQLDGIVNPNARQSLLLSTLVNLPENEARESLDSLSGYQHAADLLTTQMINRQFIRRLYDPIRSIVTTEPCCCDEYVNPCCCGLTGWFDAGGTFINVLNKKNVHGFHSQGYDLTAGVQATFCRDWTFGVAGSYEQDFMDFNRHGGTERCNTWLAGLYGLYRPAFFYGLVDLTYGYSWNHLKRSIHVGDLHYHATSKPNTEQYTFYGEVGVDWNCGCVLFQPFFGIDIGRFHRKCTRESFANGWGLAVNKRDRTLSTTRLGIHLTTNDFICNQGSLSLDLAWNYLLTDPKNHIHERFLEFGTPFEIEGSKWNRSGIDYALTFTSSIYNNLSGYIEAAGEAWANANLFNVVAGVEFCW